MVDYFNVLDKINDPIVTLYATSTDSAGDILTFTNIHVAHGIYLLSGALTADTLKEILNISGPGSISQIAIASVDATARTLRSQVIIDGTTIYDATSPSISFANKGVYVLYNLYPKVPFNDSFILNIASSLTETDKVFVKYHYYLI